MKLLLEFYAAEIRWVNCLHFLHVQNHLMHVILYSFSIKSPSKGVQLYPSPVKPRMQAQVRSSLSMLSLSQVALEWQGADWHGSGTEIQLSNSTNYYFVWKNLHATYLVNLLIHPRRLSSMVNGGRQVQVNALVSGPCLSQSALGPHGALRQGSGTWITNQNDSIIIIFARLLSIICQPMDPL